VQFSTPHVWKMRSLMNSAARAYRWCKTDCYDILIRRYPLVTFCSIFAGLHTVYYAYKYINIDRGRILYHSKYTVYRDTDEEVKYIRPPGDYPPKNINVRDYAFWWTKKSDWGY